MAGSQAVLSEGCLLVQLCLEQAVGTVIPVLMAAAILSPTIGKSSEMLEKLQKRLEWTGVLTAEKVPKLQARKQHLRTHPDPTLLSAASPPGAT